jgi:aryl-alcohol dehydrogenase-like predicted oxidoreductase
MTNTPQRRLGQSGPLVSAVGFGSWAIGGAHSRDGNPIGWGEVDDDESIAAIHEALDAGITFFDTADVYGCGHSERILGSALANHLTEVVIATKFGYTYDEQTRESPGSDASPEYIRWACDASLKRLGVEALDLYQFHLNDYPIDTAEDVVETLEDLVDAGKIRSFGWSTDDPQRAEVFARSAHCAAIQQSFNILDGNTATLQVAESYGLADIVRSPLGMGLLTGRMGTGTTFSTTDVRSNWDFYGREGERLAALEQVRDILTADGRSLAQGSLGWLLARSDAFIPIPGIRTVAQARENAGVLGYGPLSQEQMAQIQDALG